MTETKGTVLVADDEEFVLEACRLMLRQLGFRPLTACDGDEAVALLREAPDDVACVILDLSMPGMDLAATLREIRRIKREVGIILSSGYMEEEVEAMFPDGMPGRFLPKPYTIHQLHLELELSVSAAL